MKRHAEGQDVTTQNARRILRFLARNKQTLSPLLIIAHNYPDPDTLASAFTLQYIAEHVYGIQSRIVFGGTIGRTENREMVRVLKIPAKKIKSLDFRKYANFALVDTQPDFQNNLFPKNKHAAMVIDQHPSVTKPSADLVVIDPECGATSVLLARALLLSKVKITSNVATALAYGILTDTLNLYRAKRPDIIETYVHIIPHCDLRALAHIQNPVRSKKFFVSISDAIKRAFTRRSLIISHIGNVESPDLVAQVADFLLSYKRMNWAACTGRYKGKLYVSLRSTNPNAQAGEVLRDIFDNRGEAGGHGSIAGGSFRVTKGSDDQIWQEAENAITMKLFKRLRLPLKGDLYSPFRS